MMLRASSPVIQTPKLGNLRREANPFTRTRICYPRQLCFCQSETAESGVDESLQFRTGTPSLFIAEKEEAKAVLALFLKTQGLSSSFAAKTINMSDQFIEHLVSKLHSVHKTRYLIGRELSTLEIRDVLTPYMESLLKEHGDILVDVVENFPNAPVKESPKLDSPASSSPNLKKLKAIARVSEIGVDGQLPPHILYLLELGMDLDQIKSITHRFPAFAYYSLEGKIKPMVEFLLDLGVNQSDIPTILCKRPQLCGISMSENLIPMMTYLESLGMDKKKWAKVIYRFPALLTCSRQKVKATVDFFYELGLTAESVGKVLTRYPPIVGCSVEENLRPTAEYFSSLGVDVAVLVYRAPQVFGLSIEGNLKPVTEFFLEKGYSMEEWATMVSGYGSLFSYSLLANVKPKWEFFLTMDYPMSELVKFPQYFGYSLEERIKPRYAMLRESGVKMYLNQVLTVAEPKFEQALRRRVKKLDGLVCSNIEGLSLNIPALLTYSKHKLKLTVDYLYELGLTEVSIGKVLTRYPLIVGYSVEENLRPTAEYFSSLGVDVAVLVYRAPQVFGLSIEGNLKPVTEFFLEKGYSMEEWATMVSGYGSLYNYSLVDNIIPKWEFFLTMNYPMSDLVKFPQYFGYSLEQRIKPRYAQVRESGLKLSLNQVLTVAEPEFEKFLKRRMKKKLDDLGSNMEELNANFLYPNMKPWGMEKM